MRRFIPILIVILGALAIYIDLPPARFVVLSNVDAGLNQPLETKLGLDLRGGTQLTYQAVYPAGQPPTSGQMEVLRTIIENRINTTGAVEPIVQVVAGTRILVQVPGATNKKDIEELVGKTGELTFVLLPPDQYGTSASAGPQPVPAPDSPVPPGLPAVFKGSQLDASQVRASYQPPSGWVVDFAFKPDTAKAFETWTGAHVTDYMAIVLDGKIISAPTIKSQLTGGKGIIEGSFTAQSAQQLATYLQYGALPYPLQELDSSTIPATLGREFLNDTLLAGAVGILLVMLFMLIYYRLPGVVACLALTYYGLAVLAFFRIVPVTLTLAGIAGFVLSVGMAVDANILIFERTREELRAGKTLIAATEAGFSRAWNSIFDSNVSSLITASILYVLGSATIKGFALVLIIGVATSMFTAVTVSRTLLRAIVSQRFAEKAWMYGVSNEEFQARALPGRFRREARGRV